MVQQEELLRGIYSESDLLSVQYIEAHGTGTPVGDPIEAGSISKVIAKARPAGSETLRIGSIDPSMLNPRLVFVFCGNGVTYQGMCKQLLKQEPVFREKIREIEALFQRYQRMSITDKLESASNDDGFSKPDVVQPLLFAIQVGIDSLFKHWGIKPDAILGHSVGEVAAAHCSGLLSLEDAVKVIYFRSTLQNKVTGGKMLVVSNMVVSEVLNLLPSYSNKVSLAAFNSPQSCTLSGDAEAIDSLHQKLSSSVKRKNLFLRVLDVPAAYHSQMMDPILSQLEDSIGSLQVNDVETELFSTVTGKVVAQPDFSTGKYWARNIREPVSFEQAVRSAAKENKNVVFVEIGPRRALQRNIQETLGNDTIVLECIHGKAWLSCRNWQFDCSRTLAA
uniref:Malonyl-CoA:ACP transacylase (MAT) domain-containing protein n=1 Tax=Salmo trutta TaxID=8032 RepID=A0A674BFN3_SALTR